MLVTSDDWKLQSRIYYISFSPFITGLESFWEHKYRRLFTAFENAGENIKMHLNTDCCRQQKVSRSRIIGINEHLGQTLEAPLQKAETADLIRTSFLIFLILEYL